MFSAVIFAAFLIGLALADITCLKVGTNVNATWVNALNETCTFPTMVGSNFGKIPGADYNCNGRCGTSCNGISIGNVYTQQCLNHDVCSYFNNSTDGANDPNCGAAYKAAEPGFLGGAAYGCGQPNPVEPPMKPTVTPVCIPN